MLRLAIARNIFKNNNCAINNHATKYLTSNLRYLSSTQPNLSVHLTQPKEDTKTEIIYYGPLTPQIRAVKIFSLSSSTAGLLAQPIILREANTIGSTGLLIAICSVVGFFTFITPLLLHLITKKYVTEIRYDSDTSTYYATTITFFLAKKQLAFKIEDIVVPDIPGMFTTLHAKGTPLFIEAKHFKDPMHYAKMMGYDKPIDLKLSMREPESSDVKS